MECSRKKVSFSVAKRPLLPTALLSFKIKHASFVRGVFVAWAGSMRNYLIVNTGQQAELGVCRYPTDNYAIKYLLNMDKRHILETSKTYCLDFEIFHL